MPYTEYEYGSSYCDYLSLFWFYGQFNNGERDNMVDGWKTFILEIHFLNLITGLGLALFEVQFNQAFL